MSEKPPSKDEALEALDFIVNVLKEHEKDLDRLVSELGNVAGQLGETGELNGKVKKIEDKINSIQNEVGSLVKNFIATPHEVTFASTNTTATGNDNTRNNIQIVPIQTTPIQSIAAQLNPNQNIITNVNDNIMNMNSNLNSSGAIALPSGMPLTLQCSQWEDFQALSSQAQTVSFKLKENEKSIELTAIKNNQIITYTGQPPNQTNLIKTWISKQLNTPEKQILEGNIASR